MAYLYDVFFSYKRDAESDAWHRRVRDKLCFWTSHEVGRTVQIFFDDRDIPTGARWSDELAVALQGSRCLLCVWSPLYFQSDWCVSEWQSFLRRERRVGKPLIISASYCDGESFPPEALTRQFLKFNDYASTMPRFWDTDAAVHFEPLLKRLAKDLAARIRDSPPYEPNFPVYQAGRSDLQIEPSIGRIADV